MKKLIIFGTGLIAEVAEFYFRTDSTYSVAAFTNAAEYVKDDRFMGKPVLQFEGIEKVYPPSEYMIFVALGYARTNQIRESRYREAKQKGYACATYVSSRASYYGTPVGENCFILENNVIQPFVRIGDNVTLWSGNHIGHHTRIGSHCFISSHVVVSGGCDISDYCFLGVNSTIRDNIRLGKFVVVGSGALVMKDCEDRCVVRASESSYRIVTKDIL